MTIISGHQPAYLPWLGLLHKASLSDIFVYMDDVQFLDRDFNHRNRIVTPKGDTIWLTVPISRKSSASNIIKETYISRENSSRSWQEKHWSSIQSCYGKAPYFKIYSPFFKWLYLDNKWEKLADLNLIILKQVFQWFNIKTEIIIGSDQGFTEKKSKLILQHCMRFNADTLITGTLGRNYIEMDDFAAAGVKVIFQDYNHPLYSQICKNFVPKLAFVDILFNHGPDSARIMREGNVGKTEV